MQELYGINETAKTLSALILAQQEQKEKFDREMDSTEIAFEEEMALKKGNWKQQEDSLNLEYKELKERLEKARKREDEEYKYNLEQTRRKEADSYSVQKAALEQKIKEQEVLTNQLTQKDDAATQQIQTIACRALDTSAQRFASTVAYQEENTARAMISCRICEYVSMFGIMTPRGAPNCHPDLWSRLPAGS